MIHGDRSAGKAWSTKETELGCLHVDTFLGRIEVRGVPIAEVACAFKPHETDYRATEAGAVFAFAKKYENAYNFERLTPNPSLTVIAEAVSP